MGQLGLKLLKGMLVENGVKMKSSRYYVMQVLNFMDRMKHSNLVQVEQAVRQLFFSYVIQQMRAGSYKRVLLVATGALLSPLSYQQGETIPCTAHAIEITMK